MSPQAWIRIRKARQNNLQDLDVDLPKNAFVVVTGVSGSGKSTLVFDVLHAETQRRYFNSFLPTSSMALLPSFRREKPDVEAIDGLSPSIAVEQCRFPSNPRSTVGTYTDIYDFLRLLFTRLGTPTCPSCRIPIRSHTIRQMIEHLLQSPEGTRVMITAPLKPIPEKKLARLLASLKRDGFMRILWDNEVYLLDPMPALPRRPQYALELVVDRVSLKAEASGRLSGSLELAARYGSGTVRIAFETGESLTFSQNAACPRCGHVAPPPSMALFSFFHTKGMCPRCEGTGVDPAGSPKKAPAEEDVLDLPRGTPCPECKGTRLNQNARSVLVEGCSIGAVHAMTVSDMDAWLKGLDPAPHEREIAEKIREEIRQRLQALERLGLGYVSLDRPVASLSSGEAQRMRLAQQVSAPFSGIIYIIDEPSVGLHPQDMERLMEILRDLRARQNTVIVVEHDPATVLEADYVVELGPGAGPAGGRLVFAGPPKELQQCRHSITAPYLKRIRAAALKPSTGAKPFNRFLVLEGAKGHNLQNITVRFPLEALTCVTGVSGSGKSSLVVQTLYPALLRAIHKVDAPALPFEALAGWESLRRILVMDQSPAGRLPRSVPATYCGVFDPLRTLFAGLPEAKARGYSADRFSFNVSGGRCETCRGEGRVRVEMFLLPDVFITCPQCGGSRYDDETLSVRFKGLSIADVLNLSVSQAADLFRNLPTIRRKLTVMEEVGLGYLRLGQPGNTLSGGEAQRLKLARELARSGRQPSLYLFDEPTTGLHPHDVEKLVALLRRLVLAGHTVIVIEHDPDFIRCADYLVDLGPGAGPEGGRVVAEGPMPEVLTSFHTPTITALRLGR
ncbi:MAG: excinuclease ABC subunit UvrA [Desulfosoma sp.]